MCPFHPGGTSKCKPKFQQSNPVGTPSQWVIDLRASTRYLASIFVITAGTALMFVPAISMEVKALGFEAANIAFGFLFGSRIVSGFAKK